MHGTPHVFVVAALLITGLLVGVHAQSMPPGQGETTMKYEAKDFSSLMGMKGFSDQLLKNHFTLYQGYVKNTNLLLDTLKEMTPDGANPQYAELKRRLGFEFDGIRMHELYFENLGGGGSLGEDTPLAKRMKEDFGSVEAWKKDFIATGSMRGVGWAVLFEDPMTGRLMNGWVDLHQNNQLVTCAPILVMDVWEHAFMIDYQLDRKSYIQAFMDNVNWKTAASRYKETAK